MAYVTLFVFFLLTHLLLLHSAEGVERTYPDCSPFNCGKFGIISFPFTNISHRLCGVLPVNCDETPPTIRLPLELWSGKSKEVLNISKTNSIQPIRIKDFALLEYFNTNKCQYLTNFTLPNTPFLSFKLTTPNLTLFKCNHTPNITSPRNYIYMSCGNYNIYYSFPRLASQCSIIQLPVKVHTEKKKLI